MTRETFLTIAALIAMSIGGITSLIPEPFLETVKGASLNGTAVVMTRTTGVILFVVGLLAFLVRRHASSPTMRAILAANLALQLLFLPIDPIAFANGIFHGYASFIPNTLVHMCLAGGFAHFLWTHPRTR